MTTHLRNSVRNYRIGADQWDDNNKDEHHSANVCSVNNNEDIYGNI